MKTFPLIAALLLAASASSASAKPAQTMVCLPAGHIASRSVVSDEVVRYRMDDGTVWRNTLQHACPGLSVENGFSEEIRGAEVCSNQQTIHVLRRGTPCFLGDFTREPAPEKPAPAG